MDVGLRLLVSLFFWIVMKCLNPCCDGCRSATYEVPVFREYEELVSILVVMDVGLRRSDKLDIWYGNKESQSLL